MITSFRGSLADVLTVPCAISSVHRRIRHEPAARVNPASILRQSAAQHRFFIVDRVMS